MAQPQRRHDHPSLPGVTPRLPQLFQAERASMPWRKQKPRAFAAPAEPGVSQSARLQETNLLSPSHKNTKLFKLSEPQRSGGSNLLRQRNQAYFSRCACR